MTDAKGQFFGWFYFDKNGNHYKSQMITNKSSKKSYYFNSTGQLATGKTKIGKKYYFFATSDANAHRGWMYKSTLIRYQNKWYYAETTTSMKNGWLKDNGKWYYLYEGGEMATGIIEDKEKRYYLNGNGEMITGWISDNGTWYYGDSNGQLVKGFITLGVDTYYFNDDNNMVTGNQTINNKEYYFHSDGAMARFEFIVDRYYGKDGIFKDIANGEKLTIVLDPGHNYGGDDGAYSQHNGIQYIERDLNMQVALKLREQLEVEGYNVILTRNPEDKTYETTKESLKKRVDYANSNDTDLFISIHHDSSTSSSASGFTAFYSSIKGNSTGKDSKVTNKSKEIAVIARASITVEYFFGFSKYLACGADASPPQKASTNGTKATKVVPVK